jgi:hypothetical protein
MTMISPYVELALWVVGFFYFLGMMIITHVMDQEGLVRNKGMSPLTAYFWLPVLWPLWIMLTLINIWHNHDRV